MSVKVMSWVFENSRSRKNARLVLLAIADCANDEGLHAYPSMPKLQQKTGLSERSVTNLVADLERIGELRVQRNAGPNGCNLYSIIMTPAESAPPPPQNLHPAKSAPPQKTTGTPAELAGPPPQNLRVTPAKSAPGTVIEPSVEPSVEPSSSGTPAAPPDPAPDDQREDVDRICRYLAEWIVRNGSKKPTITKKWRDEARLLIDRDGRPLDEIREIIAWSQKNDFWKANIHSMPKLRQKYDQLRLQAQRATASGDGHHQSYRDPEDSTVYATGL